MANKSTAYKSCCSTQTYSNFDTSSFEQLCYYYNEMERLQVSAKFVCFLDLFQGVIKLKK